MTRTHFVGSSRMLALVAICLAMLSVQTIAQEQTNEWPRWRGPRGDGTWATPALPSEWPRDGLSVLWRQPIGGGYSGVVVADRRTYTMDRQTEPTSIERVLCFDALTGEPLWTHSYDAEYGKLAYDSGPRASPTVHGGYVYTLGAVGHLYCLDALTGAVLWVKDTVAELGAQQPRWGFAASPIIWNDLVIAHIAAQPGGCLVAFDRFTGKEAWRTSGDPAGYSTPIVIQHQDHEQLICWSPKHILSFSPDTGEPYWSLPYDVTNGVSIATPIFQEGIVFVSGYWEGSKAILLGDDPHDATLLWEDSELLRGLMSQPLYRQGHVYLLDKIHGLSCFELKTGRKLWDDANQMTPRGRNPQATMVWVGDTGHMLVLNSDGELILAQLSPEGYTEHSRTRIIGRTWAHPAYSGNHVYARSDEELVCISIR